MSDIVALRAGSPAAIPTIRHIGTADLLAALRAGWADFLAIPTQLVFLCILYPIVGLVAARAAVGTELLPLLFPLVAGMALLGPVLAVGVYELSRRREAGQTTSWLNAFDVLRSPAIFAIVMIGALLLAIFTAWIGVARLVYELTLGAGAAVPATPADLVHLTFATPAGWAMVAIGDVVGALFAVAVLTLTVVSVPMALDRHVSPILAIQTSIRAVRANPVTLALWGVMVGALLALGSLPFFIGLAVVMPVLGHATWHLYRRLVA